MEVNEFRRIIFGLAMGLPKYAPKFEDEPTLRIWYSAFLDVSPEQLKTACRLAMTTLEEFPSVKKLKALCNGNIGDDIQLGQDLAHKIGQAIGNIGGYKPEEAREQLGELAWKVVQRHGGWWDLCNLESNQALEFLKKDMAKTATSIYQNHQAFGEEKKIGLPEKVGTDLKPLGPVSATKYLNNPEGDKK